MTSGKVVGTIRYLINGRGLHLVSKGLARVINCLFLPIVVRQWYERKVEV